MNKKLTPNQQDVINTIVVIMLAIIAALAALCFTVYTTKAMSNDMPTVNHYGGCTPYTRSMVLSSVTGYSHTAMLQHSACDGQVVTKKHAQSRTVSNSGTVVPTQEPKIVEPPVIVTPDEPKVEHSHCNNGEGNGSEGCSPAQSSHANNDENHTTPKEDKSNH